MSNPAIRLDDHDGWLLSFVNGERRAYLDVRLFLAAVGKLQYDNHCHAAFNAKDLQVFSNLCERDGVARVSLHNSSG